MTQIIWAASPPDDAHIEEAKAWVKLNGYTRDDVDIRKNERSVWVQFKPERSYE